LQWILFIYAQKINQSINQSQFLCLENQSLVTYNSVLFFNF
jgi:hypothetical protein